MLDWPCSRNNNRNSQAGLGLTGAVRVEALVWVVVGVVLLAWVRMVRLVGLLLRRWRGLGEGFGLRGVLLV